METRRAQAFEVLGIPSDSDTDAVTHAYRRLARLTHPDVSASPEAAGRFASLAAAYKVAFDAAASAGRSVSVETSTAGCGDSAPRSGRGYRWPESDGTRGRGPARRWRAPIVAGPVVVRPLRRTSPGEATHG